MISEKEWNELKTKSKLLKQAADILRVDKKDVPRVTKRFMNELTEMEKSLKEKLNSR
jgi:alanyl-tRNA synthetase